MQLQTKYLWHKMKQPSKLFKSKAGPSPINMKKKLKYGIEQQANLLKNIKGN